MSPVQNNSAENSSQDGILVRQHEPYLPKIDANSAQASLMGAGVSAYIPDGRIPKISKYDNSLLAIGDNRDFSEMVGSREDFLETARANEQSAWGNAARMITGRVASIVPKTLAVLGSIYGLALSPWKGINSIADNPVSNLFDGWDEWLRESDTFKIYETRKSREGDILDKMTSSKFYENLFDGLAYSASGMLYGGAAGLAMKGLKAGSTALKVAKVMSNTIGQTLNEAAAEVRDFGKNIDIQSGWNPDGTLNMQLDTQWTRKAKQKMNELSQLYQQEIDSKNKEYQNQNKTLENQNIYFKAPAEELNKIKEKYKGLQDDILKKIKKEYEDTKSNDMIKQYLGNAVVLSMSNMVESMIAHGNPLKNGKAIANAAKLGKQVNIESLGKRYAKNWLKGGFSESAEEVNQYGLQKAATMHTAQGDDFSNSFIDYTFGHWEDKEKQESAIIGALTPGAFAWHGALQDYNNDKYAYAMGKQKASSIQQGITQSIDNLANGVREVFEYDYDMNDDGTYKVDEKGNKVKVYRQDENGNLIKNNTNALNIQLLERNTNQWLANKLTAIQEKDFVKEDYVDKTLLSQYVTSFLTNSGYDSTEEALTDAKEKLSGLKEAFKDEPELYDYWMKNINRIDEYGKVFKEFVDANKMQMPTVEDLLKNRSGDLSEEDKERMSNVQWRLRNALGVKTIIDHIDDQIEHLPLNENSVKELEEERKYQQNRLEELIDSKRGNKAYKEMNNYIDELVKLQKEVPAKLAINGKIAKNNETIKNNDKELSSLKGKETKTKEDEDKIKTIELDQKRLEEDNADLEKGKVDTNSVEYKTALNKYQEQIYVKGLDEKYRKFMIGSFTPAEKLTGTRRYKTKEGKDAVTKINSAIDNYFIDLGNRYSKNKQLEKSLTSLEHSIETKLSTNDDMKNELSIISEVVKSGIDEKTGNVLFTPDTYSKYNELINRRIKEFKDKLNNIGEQIEKNPEEIDEFNNLQETINNHNNTYGTLKGLNPELISRYIELLNKGHEAYQAVNDIVQQYETIKQFIPIQVLEEQGKIVNSTNKENYFVRHFADEEAYSDGRTTTIANLKTIEKYYKHLIKSPELKESDIQQNVNTFIIPNNFVKQIESILKQMEDAKSIYTKRLNEKSIPEDTFIGNDVVNYFTELDKNIAMTKELLDKVNDIIKERAEQMKRQLANHNSNRFIGLQEVANNFKDTNIEKIILDASKRLDANNTDEAQRNNDTVIKIMLNELSHLQEKEDIITYITNTINNITESKDADGNFNFNGFTRKTLPINPLKVALESIEKIPGLIVNNTELFDPTIQYEQDNNIDLLINSIKTSYTKSQDTNVDVRELGIAELGTMGLTIEGGEKAIELLEMVKRINNLKQIKDILDSNIDYLTIEKLKKEVFKDFPVIPNVIQEIAIDDIMFKLHQNIVDSLWLEGISGSGKTTVIASAIKQMLKLKNNQVIASAPVVDNKLTQLDKIGQEIGADIKISVTELASNFDKYVNDDIRLIVIDESGLIDNNNDFTTLVQKVKDINSKRDKSKQLGFIFMLDPQQPKGIGQISNFVWSQDNLKIITSLNISERANVSEITSAGAIFQGKRYNVKNGEVNSNSVKNTGENTLGVQVARTDDDIINSIKSKLNNGREKLIITDNPSKWEKLLIDNVTVYSLEQVKDMLYTPRQVQGLDKEEVYIDIEKDNKLGEADYNSIMYMAITRAKKYVMIKSDILKHSLQSNVQEKQVVDMKTKRSDYLDNKNDLIESLKKGIPVNTNIKQESKKVEEQEISSLQEQEDNTTENEYKTNESLSEEINEDNVLNEVKKQIEGDKKTIEEIYKDNTKHQELIDKGETIDNRDNLIINLSNPQGSTTNLILDAKRNDARGNDVNNFPKDGDAIKYVPVKDANGTLQIDIYWNNEGKAIKLGQVPYKNKTNFEQNLYDKLSNEVDKYKIKPYKNRVTNENTYDNADFESLETIQDGNVVSVQPFRITYDKDVEFITDSDDINSVLTKLEKLKYSFFDKNQSYKLQSIRFFTATKSALKSKEFEKLSNKFKDVSGKDITLGTTYALFNYKNDNGDDAVYYIRLEGRKFNESDIEFLNPIIELNDKLSDIESGIQSLFTGKIPINEIEDTWTFNSTASINPINKIIRKLAELHKIDYTNNDVHTYTSKKSGTSKRELDTYKLTTKSPMNFDDFLSIFTDIQDDYEEQERNIVKGTNPKDFNAKQIEKIAALWSNSRSKDRKLPIGYSIIGKGDVEYANKIVSQLMLLSDEEKQKFVELLNTHSQGLINLLYKAKLGKMFSRRTDVVSKLLDNNLISGEETNDENAESGYTVSLDLDSEAMTRFTTDELNHYLDNDRSIDKVQYEKIQKQVFDYFMTLPEEMFDDKWNMTKGKNIIDGIFWKQSAIMDGVSAILTDNKITADKVIGSISSVKEKYRDTDAINILTKMLYYSYKNIINTNGLDIIIKSNKAEQDELGNEREGMVYIWSGKNKTISRIDYTGNKEGLEEARLDHRNSPVQKVLNSIAKRNKSINGETIRYTEKINGRTTVRSKNIMIDTINYIQYLNILESKILQSPKATARWNVSTDDNGQQHIFIYDTLLQMNNQQLEAIVKICEQCLYKDKVMTTDEIAKLYKENVAGNISNLTLQNIIQGKSELTIQIDQSKVNSLPEVKYDNDGNRQVSKTNLKELDKVISNNITSDKPNIQVSGGVLRINNISNKTTISDNVSNSIVQENVVKDTSEKLNNEKKKTVSKKKKSSNINEDDITGFYKTAESIPYNFIDMEQMIKYARTIIKDITDDEIKFMTDNMSDPSIHGFFYQGRLFVEKYTELDKDGNIKEGTLKEIFKHELFHKIWQQYIPVKDRTKYFEAFKTEYKIKYGKEFTGTNIEMEEALARLYQVYENKKENISNNWLRRLFRYIKSIFNMFVPKRKSAINLLFDKINNGEFSTRLINNNDVTSTRELSDVLRVFNTKENFDYLKKLLYNIADELRSNGLTKNDPDIGEFSFGLRQDEDIFYEIKDKNTYKDGALKQSLLKQLKKEGNKELYDIIKNEHKIRGKKGTNVLITGYAYLINDAYKTINLKVDKAVEIYDEEASEYDKYEDVDTEESEKQSAEGVKNETIEAAYINPMKGLSPVVRDILANIKTEESTEFGKQIKSEDLTTGKAFEIAFHLLNSTRSYSETTNYSGDRIITEEISKRIKDNGGDHYFKAVATKLGNIINDAYDTDNVYDNTIFVSDDIFVIHTGNENLHKQVDENKRYISWMKHINNKVEESNKVNKTNDKLPYIFITRDVNEKSSDFFKRIILEYSNLYLDKKEENYKDELENIKNVVFNAWVKYNSIGQLTAIYSKISSQHDPNYDIISKKPKGENTEYFPFEAGDDSGINRLGGDIFMLITHEYNNLDTDVKKEEYIKRIKKQYEKITGLPLRDFIYAYGDMFGFGSIMKSKPVNNKDLNELKKLFNDFMRIHEGGFYSIGTPKSKIKDQMWDFDSVIRYKKLDKNISKILNKYDTYSKPLSIIDGDNKRRYRQSPISNSRSTIQHLVKRGERGIAYELPNFMGTDMYKYNPFITGTSSIFIDDNEEVKIYKPLYEKDGRPMIKVYRVSGYTGLKTEYNDFSIFTDYTTEGSKESLERTFFGNFIGGIANTPYNQGAYFQEFFNPAHRTLPEGALTELIILSKDRASNKDLPYIKDVIRQTLLHRAARPDLKSKYKYYDRTNTTCFKVIDDILNNSRFDLTKEEREQIRNNDSKIINKLTDLIYEQFADYAINRIDDIFNNDCDINTVSLNAINWTNIVDKKYWESRLKEVLILKNFKYKELNVETNKYEFIKDEAHIKNLKNKLLPILHAYICNDYLQSYNFAELTIGSMAFFKTGVDVAKRYQLSSTPLIMPFVDKYIGMPETYRVIIGEDLKPDKVLYTRNGKDTTMEEFVRDEIEKTIKLNNLVTPEQQYNLKSLTYNLFNLLCKYTIDSNVSEEELLKDQKHAFEELGKLLVSYPLDYEITDGQAIGTPLFFDKLKSGYGKDYNIQQIIKPVAYGKTSDSIQSMKCSMFELTDDLCNKFPIMKNLRDKMYNTSKPVDVFIFKSAVKMSVPKVTQKTDEINKGITGIKEDLIYDFKSYEFGMSFNPHHHVENSDTALPTQLIYFSAPFSVENEKTSYVIYNAISELYKLGYDNILSETTAINKSKQNTFYRKIFAGAGNEALYDLVDTFITKEVDDILNIPVLTDKLEIGIGSQINKKVIKLRLPGTKLILASVVGSNTKYYAKDGTIKYMNINDILPTDIEEMARNLEYKKDKDGNMYAEMILPEGILSKEFEERIKKELARGIRTTIFKHGELLGFRIPSSEIHSAVPIRIKGFYDSKGTNIIIAPDQLIAQHGCDFDVDSMFIMSRSIMKIYTKEEKEEISKLKTILNNKELLKEERQKIGKILASIKKKAPIENVYPGYIYISEKDANDNEIGHYKWTGLTANQIKKYKEDTTNAGKKYLIAYYKNEIIEHMLKLYSSYNEINRYRMLRSISKEAFKKAEIDLYKYRYPEKWAETITEMPSASEEEVANVFMSKAKTDLDLSNYSDRKEAHSRIHGGKAGVGIVSNMIKIMAYMNDTGVNGQTTLKGLDFKFAKDGELLTFNGLNEGDIKDWDGWYELDGLQNVALDNIKDQIAPAYNLNNETYPPFCLLIGMHMHWQDIKFFITQPIMWKVTSFSGKYEKNGYPKAMGQLLKKMKEFSNVFNELPDDQFKTIVDMKVNEDKEPLDINELRKYTHTEYTLDRKKGDNFKNEFVDINDESYSMFLLTQYKVLKEYNRLHNLIQDMQKLQRIIGIISDYPRQQEQKEQLYSDINSIFTIKDEVDESNVVVKPALSVKSFPFDISNFMNKNPHIKQAIEVFLSDMERQRTHNVKHGEIMRNIEYELRNKTEIEYIPEQLEDEGKSLSENEYETKPDEDKTVDYNNEGKGQMNVIEESNIKFNYKEGYNSVLFREEIYKMFLRTTYNYKDYTWRTSHGTLLEGEKAFINMFAQKLIAIKKELKLNRNEFLNNIKCIYEYDKWNIQFTGQSSIENSVMEQAKLDFMKLANYKFTLENNGTINNPINTYIVKENTEEPDNTFLHECLMYVNLIYGSKFGGRSYAGILPADIWLEKYKGESYVDKVIDINKKIKSLTSEQISGIADIAKIQLIMNNPSAIPTFSYERDTNDGIYIDKNGEKVYYDLKYNENDLKYKNKKFPLYIKIESKKGSHSTFYMYVKVAEVEGKVFYSFVGDANSNRYYNLEMSDLDKTYNYAEHFNARHKHIRLKSSKLNKLDSNTLLYTEENEYLNKNDELFIRTINDNSRLNEVYVRVEKEEYGKYKLHILPNPLTMNTFNGIKYKDEDIEAAIEIYNRSTIVC